MARRARKLNNKKENQIAQCDNITLLKKGFILHKQGKIKQAGQYYKKILENDENDYNALQLLGMLETESGNYIKAISLMNKSLKQKPDQPSVYNNLGNAYFNVSDVKNAEKCYKKAVELKNDYVEAIDNMGILFLKNNRLEEAKKLYIKLSNIAPDYPQTYNNLGGIYFKEGQMLKAEANYLKAIKLNSNMFQPLFNLGKLYKESKRINKSIEFYKKAIQSNPQSYDTYYNLGNLYHENHENQKAAENYQKAYELKPDFPDLLLNMASTHHRLGNDELAKNTFEKYLKYNKSKTVEHMINALDGVTTQKSPDEYVIELFDNYAYNFDSHLVKRLKYISPEKITSMICEHDIFQKPNILDLGCGTGLVVENLIQKITINEAIGIDISSQMLEKAKEKRIYKKLICKDINEYLSKEELLDFDIITSTDVFIYLGSPEKTFKKIGEKTKKGTLFAFDFEVDNCQTFKLRRTGRYAHNEEYMSNLCTKNGFKIINNQEDNIRFDLGKPIKGKFIIAQKQ